MLLKLSSPVLSAENCFLQVSLLVDVKPLVVGIFDQGGKIFRVKGVENIEEIFPVYGLFPLNPFILEEGLDRWIVSHQLTDSNAGQFIILGDIYELDLAALKQLLLSRQNLLDKLLVEVFGGWEVILEPKWERY